MLDKSNTNQGYLCGRLFALDDDGKYQEVPSAGWSPRNEAVRFAWNSRKEEAGQVREKVLSGKYSPLAFHMAVNQMSVGLLAQYVRLNRWRVKRHLNPEVFRRLKPAILRRYADLFGLTPAQLQQVPAGAAPCFRENSLLCK